MKTNRIDGILARFVPNAMIIEGKRYICYFATDNKKHDFVTFWLMKPYSTKYVATHFIIAAMTDTIINDLYLDVINEEDIASYGRLWCYEQRTNNALY